MLQEKAIALLSAPNYATLTTLFGDGHPQTNLVWVGHDGENVLVNTERHRQKFLNVERDLRVTVLVWDRDDMWSCGEIRSTVIETVGGQVARDHINEFAKNYLGVDDYPNPIQSERVILKIAPSRQVAR